MIIVTNIGTTMRYLIYLTYIFSSVAGAGEIHKWVDEEGNIYYGDAPPVSISTKQVKVIGAPSNPGRKLPRLGDESAQQEAGTSSESDDQETAAVPQDQATLACENARKDLKVINKGGRIRLRMADGSTRAMTPEEIEERRTQTEEDIKIYCQESN